MAYMWGRRERWINRYCSNHQILLVGEGDFSFSLSLATAFDSAVNIVATSLDTRDELLKYRFASFNLERLKCLGATLCYGVDTTRMSFLYPALWGRKFHRIIFNFPHAGFFGKEDNPVLIEMHRKLVRGFFQNARNMLYPDGEIHVSHKVTHPFTAWKIEDLASECWLHLVGLDMFNITDYPYYENKRGSGPRPDDPFPLGESRTFRFKLRPSSENILGLRSNLDGYYPVSVLPQTMYHRPRSPPLQPAPYISRHLTRGHIHEYKSGDWPNEQATECQKVFGGYLEETFGSNSYDARESVRGAWNTGFETFAGVAPGRSENRHISGLEESGDDNESRHQHWRELVSRFGTKL